MKSAREGGVRTVLAVVHGIGLTLRSGSGWMAHGGQVWVDQDWQPTDQTLEATQYRYHPNCGR